VEADGVGGSSGQPKPLQDVNVEGTIKSGSFVRWLER